MQLWKVTASQIPVLETSLRRWRLLASSSSLDNYEESSSALDVSRRRVERECTRLLHLLSTLQQDETVGGPNANAVACVHPFCQVLKSSAMSSQTKACAVECLERIISSLTAKRADAVEALTQVCEAILECRFESYYEENADAAADEVGKIWLLEGLAACSRFTQQEGGGGGGGVALLLPEEVLFRIFETLFDAATAPFNSETVKSVALRILSRFTRDLFSVAAIFFGSEDPQLALTARRSFLFLVEMADPEHVTSSLHHALPSNLATVSWTRFVALRLLVEACLASTTTSSNGRLAVLADAAILEIIKDDLMRTLVQTAQRVGNNHLHGSNSSSDPFRLFVISETLRLANILLGDAECRAHIRVQTEVFFNAVYCRVLERAISPKHRSDEAVLVLESLCDLISTSPNLLLDLFASYDLNLHGTDVFENVLKLVTRLAHPTRLSVPALDTFRLLSLRGLLASLRSLAAVVEAVEEEGAGALAEEARAEEFKQRKLALNRCAEAFNSKPSKGVLALVNEGVLQPAPDMDPLILASFLRNTPSLDKVAIGLFLGEEAEFNRQVLRCYTETFDVRSRTLVDSLRSFLECFRLPKEAQQIDRIIQAFADVAYLQCLDAEHFPTVDSCYLLCFAIIMLNTDLHNPNIRPERKMTLAQFSNNNRNYGEEISKKRDFPAHFLQQIFDAIAKREINTLKDGSSVTAEVSSDKWSDLLARSRNNGNNALPPQPSSLPLLANGGNGYKKYMFKTIWKHALVAVKVVFASGQTAEQPEALHQALDGFLVLAKCSAVFQLNDAFDCVMADLCKFTSLLVYNNQLQLQDQALSRSSSSESEAQTIATTTGGNRALNALARDFGSNHKGQMAAMSVFALTRKFGSNLRKGWRHVLWCVLRLVDLELITPSAVLLVGAELPAAFEAFHLKVRDAVLDVHDMNMQIKRKASSTGAGAEEESGISTWASWLLGISSQEEEERAKRAWLEMDEEHRACMSGLGMCDALMLPSKSSTLPAGAAEAAATDVEMQYALECVKSCRPLGILKDSANLSEEALGALLDALLQAMEVSPPSNAAALTPTIGSKDDLDIDLLSPPSLGSRIIALHFAAEICTHNLFRFDQVFTQRLAPALLLLASKLQDGKPPSFLLEQVYVSLLRMCLAGVLIAPNAVVDCLVAIAGTSFPSLDELLCSVVLDMVSNTAFWNESVPISGWPSLFALVGKLRTSPRALEVMRAASMFAKDKRELIAFATTELWSGTAADGEAPALQQQQQRVIDFVASFNEDAFALQTLGELAQRPDLVVADNLRVCAQAMLRTLLCSSGQVVSPPRFASLVLPVCERALALGRSHPKTQMAACELLVKGFLHHCAAMSSSGNAQDFAKLWVQVLETLERFKQQQGQGGGEVEETCTELLKNLLLALGSQNILSRSKTYFAVTGQVLEEDAQQQEQGVGAAETLWEATWAVLDRSPALLKDLHEIPGISIDLREQVIVSEEEQQQQPSVEEEAVSVVAEEQAEE